MLNVELTRAEAQFVIALYRCYFLQEPLDIPRTEDTGLWRKLEEAIKEAQS